MVNAVQDELGVVELASKLVKIPSVNGEEGRLGTFLAGWLAEAGLRPEDIQSLNDISRLPFTTAADLRDGYPFPLLSVPESQEVRIHASSGTNGKRKSLS